jgi:hypothetical protein
VIIETPLIQEIVQESQRSGQVKGILHLLQEKFGPPGPDVNARLTLLKDEDKLLRLLSHAAHCRSLTAFEEKLREELPRP